MSSVSSVDSMQSVSAMRSVFAVVKQQLRILRRDPWFLGIMFGMPLVVMPLFKKTMGLSLRASGFSSANGAEQVVPGQVVMFGFFVAGSAGFCVFREHGWKTWDRLRASSVSSRSLLLGFGLPWIAIHVLFQIALFAAGGVVLGLRPNGGSLLAVLLMLVAFSTCVVSLIMLTTATFRTVNQVSAFQNVGAMAFSGLGGALVPVSQLPGWAQAIAPITPSYWAMRGHTSVFLKSGGLGDVLFPAGVLFAAAAVLFGLATIRFRVDETKQFFA
jgi:ABC-2 type transport system permease protein